MAIFIMMCGFPGSGKSTYAQKVAAEYNATVFSSDALRKELYGSEAVQDHNEEVFDILSKRMLEALKVGKNVVFDAMNINSKNRRHTLQLVSRYVTEKIVYIIATPYEECLRRNGLRERHVPEYVIKRAYMNFTMPCKQEGFTDIKIIYPENQQFISPGKVVEDSVDISHDNPHHTFSVGNHMIAAYVNFITNYAGYSAKYKETTGEELPARLLATAILVHDLGKPFTKTFTNMKNEQTDVAHYYGHNNAGAYDCLFLQIPEENRIDTALLIQYHMHYFMSWKDSSKAKHKDYNFLGNKLSCMLEILHECDLAGH